MRFKNKDQMQDAKSCIDWAAPACLHRVVVLEVNGRRRGGQDKEICIDGERGEGWDGLLHLMDRIDFQVDEVGSCCCAM